MFEEVYFCTSFSCLEILSKTMELAILKHVSHSRFNFWLWNFSRGFSIVYILHVCTSQCHSGLTDKSDTIYQTHHYILSFRIQKVGFRKVKKSYKDISIQKRCHSRSLMTSTTRLGVLRPSYQWMTVSSGVLWEKSNNNDNTTVLKSMCNSVQQRTNGQTRQQNLVSN